MGFEPPATSAFDGYDPEDEARREALLTLGNGLLSLRGAAPWAKAGDTHYPGLYRAGLYNRLPDVIEGQEVWNESVVNLPNPTFLTFRHEGEEEWFALDRMQVISYRHALDATIGVTMRDLVVEDLLGRRTSLKETRFVSMDEPELMALRLEIRPQNWQGRIELCSAIDGHVANDRVACLKHFSSQHLVEVSGTVLEPGIGCVTARTSQSDVAIAVAARTSLSGDWHGEDRQHNGRKEAEERFICDVPDEGIAVEKTMAIATGGQGADRALALVRNAGGFDDLLAAHRQGWASLSEHAHIEAEAPDLATALRLAEFRILQTVSPHVLGHDVGFPSRGWQEAYRGQIFWDEMLVLPYLTSHFPDLAKALLLYRYRRLDDARANAAAAGFRGAMFPWRSASDGGEHTPRFQWNPLSGRWMRDNTNLQRHIASAVAYNVWNYCLCTGDESFQHGEGAEIILEVARFWGSIARYNAKQDRFDISGIVGPDEYHTAYPDADAPGLRNNTYTNVMAAWTLARALELLDRLPTEARGKVERRLKIDDAELRHWDRVSRRLRVEFSADGTLLPFAGFDRLLPLSPEELEAEAPGKRPDWLMESRGDDINRYKLAKQADTLMLPYLLSHGQLAETLDRLGYRFTAADMRRTAAEDLARMSHDSSLSELVCAGALSSFDPERSWECFKTTLEAEHDPSGPTTSGDGAHLGAMAGALDVLQRHYLGFAVDEAGIQLCPNPPAALRGIKIRQLCRHGRFALLWDGTTLSIESDPANRGPVTVRHPEGSDDLAPGSYLAIQVGTRDGEAVPDAAQ